MLYCEKCRSAVNEGEKVCPVCGARKLRPVREDDPCFLVEKDQIWSEVVEDLLKEGGIPYLMKGRMGAGLAISVGPMFEKNRYYVNFPDLERARELMDSVFAEKEETAGEPRGSDADF